LELRQEVIEVVMVWAGDGEAGRARRERWCSECTP